MRESRALSRVVILLSISAPLFLAAQTPVRRPWVDPIGVVTDSAVQHLVSSGWVMSRFDPEAHHPGLPGEYDFTKGEYNMYLHSRGGKVCYAITMWAPFPSRTPEEIYTAELGHLIADNGMPDSTTPTSAHWRNGLRFERDTVFTGFFSFEYGRIVDCLDGKREGKRKRS